MHIRFPQKDEEFIKNAVAEGYYTNETEVVRDAVRRKRESEEKHRKLREIVLEAEASIARGEGVPLTKELMDEIFESAKRKAENNESYNSPYAIPDST